MSWFREHLPHCTGERVAAVTFFCSLQTQGVSRYCLKSQPLRAELCQVTCDPRPSPGEKLRACQEDKHVWHCTNQAIIASITLSWIQPKGGSEAEPETKPFTKVFQNRYPRNVEHPLSHIICAGELPLMVGLVQAMNICTGIQVI